MAFRSGREHWLLLTATVYPPNDSANLAIRDPVERFRQYRDAFTFYVTTIIAPTDSYFTHLVFAENSGADLSAFHKIANDHAPGQVSFVSCIDQYFPPDFDRGYRELRLIRMACRECHELAAALEAGALVWKVTGRYRVLNLTRVTTTLPDDRNLYVDLRRWPKNWCEMRVLGFDKSGLEGFLAPVTSLLTTGLATEELLYRFVARQLTGESFGIGGLHPSVAKKFRVEPIVDGLRGADGQSYLRGANRLKYAIRIACRGVANAFR